ncbi:MAG TPA: hypothetical protein VMU48_16725 [Terracidiphilus sp.]|nr:hypothetical protein [Terracidiphilus sp.]
MEANKYCVYNRAKESTLSAGVTVIDTTLEPLKVLRVMIEGLALNSETGLWLNPLRDVPRVPRLAPFDLVYLDKDQRVIQGAELLPGIDFPDFADRPESALVLPFKTMSSSHTGPGDLLAIEVAEEPVTGLAELVGQAERTPEIVQIEEEPPKWRPNIIETPPTAEPPEIETIPDSQIDESKVAEPADTERPFFVSKAKLAEPVVEPKEPEPARVLPVQPAAKPLPPKTPVQKAVPAAPIAKAPVAQKAKAVAPPKASPKPTVAIGKDAEAAEKPEAESEARVPVVLRVLRWLYPDLSPPQNHRAAVRRPTSEMVAYQWVDGELLPLEVSDISSTGVYVKTEQRWQPGERVSLILQRKGPPEESPERQFLVDAGAVRWGHDGVGLAFILPPGMDVHIWEGPLKRRDDEREPEYVLREFRMSRALGFVGRICPAVVKEVDLLLHRNLSNYRLSSAVEIALKAEMMLANDPHADELSAPAEMVMRILELGSWAEGDLMHKLWAGMLATSCTEGGQDTSNLVFVDILTAMTVTHARILAAACEKAIKFTSNRGVVSSFPLYFSADEVMKIAGTNDLSKIHRTIALMSDYGLFEKSVKSSFIATTEQTKATPTSMGLRFYAHCKGQREVK